MGEGRLQRKVRDFLCLIFVGSNTKHKTQTRGAGTKFWRVLFCLKGKFALKN